MNFKLVFKLTGITLLLLSAAMIAPLLVSFYYGEDIRPFFYSIIPLAAVGRLFSLPRAERHFFSREGFFSVGLIWVLLGLGGGLPFWFSGQYGSFIDCFFESISGFTTTGSTVLKTVEHLPRGILFWRAETVWIGGVGVLILTIALLPKLGVRLNHLMRAESPGPVKLKLVPKVSNSSKIIYGIYIALTAIEALCLLLTGLPLYDSVVTAFSTAGTGGAAVRNLSIGAYGNPAAEIVVTVFMVLFSISFAAYYLILCGKWKRAAKSDELRFFLGLLAFSTVAIAVNIRSLYPTLGETVRRAAFQSAAILSTTGFTTANYNLWPESSRVLLVVLMLVGGCAGSTSSGLKASRVLLIFRSMFREMKQIIHPRAVNVVKLDGQVVEEEALHSVAIYFSAYMMVILGASLIIGLDNFSFGTTFTAAIACVSNVGLGLEMIGPSGSFGLFSPLSKIVMSLCMIIGRLEIFPVLILFNRHAWRRS